MKRIVGKNVDQKMLVGIVIAHEIKPVSLEDSYDNLSSESNLSKSLMHILDVLKSFHQL